MWNLILLIQSWNHLKVKFIKADPFELIFPEVQVEVEEVQVLAEEVPGEEVIQVPVVIQAAVVHVHQAVITRKKIRALLILINQVMVKKNLRIDLLIVNPIQEDLKKRNVNERFG